MSGWKIAVFFFKICLFREKMANSQLVSHHNVGNPDSLFCLLISIFMPMKLRVDSTELKMQSTLKL